MNLHPHLTEFYGELSLYQDVRLFYLVPGFQGLWQEQISHSRGGIEDVLVLIKIRDRLYRYDSPDPIHARISQIDLAEIIREKLMGSVWFQVSIAISGIGAAFRPSRSSVRHQLPKI